MYQQFKDHLWQKDSAAFKGLAKAVSPTVAPFDLGIA